MSPLAKHHWLVAGLVRLGWKRDMANKTAFAFLLGRPLFANEIEDCVAALESPDALKEYHQRDR